MSRSSFLLGAFLASVSASDAACGVLSLDTSAPVNTVGEYFASWNIDASRDRLFFDVDWRNAKLVRLLSQIGGSNIRFGGTGNDALYYGLGNAPPCGKTVDAKYECLNSTTWDALTALSTAASSSLVVGLNIHPAGTVSPPAGEWDETNARALLSDAKSKGVSIWGAELGNEQNTIMSAAQQAAAFVRLGAVLDDVYGAGAADRPRLVGPDTHSFRDAGSRIDVVLKYLQDFARGVGSSLFAVTHHEYIEITADNILNASFLDLSRSIANATVAAVRAVSPTLKVWAGEIGPHNGGTYGPGGVTPNCAGNKVCGRFGSTLWYADSMASKAAAGYDAYNRQDVIGADYGLINSTSIAPSPDYFLLRVWQATVGARVLDVAVSGAPPTLRAYAHCAAQGDGAVALVLINLDVGSACVAPPAWAASGTSALVYALTPGTGGVTAASALLNGRPLAVNADGVAPPVVGAPVDARAPLTLPPMSVSVVVVPAAAGAVPACA